MKYLILVCVLCFGCAHADQVTRTLNAFADGHRLAQKAVSQTQDFCISAHEELVKQGLSTTRLDSYCRSMWDLMLDYKELTDKLIKEQN